MKANYITSSQHLEIRDLKFSSSDCYASQMQTRKSEIKIRIKGKKSISVNIQKASSSCGQHFSLWDCFSEIASFKSHSNLRMIQISKSKEELSLIGCY